MTTHGFPNFFFIGFSQGGLSANITSIFDQQGDHIAYIIREGLRRGATSIECSLEAQEAWVQTIRASAIDTSAFQRECTPSYFNNEGEDKQRWYLGEPYGPGFYAFDDLIRKWREQGDLAGLIVT